MARLAQTEDLTDIQIDILAAVHDFVEKEIIPNANTLEHADEYPTEIVEGLKELGCLRSDDPRGVRRLGRVPDHLRAGRRRDRARLDECLRRHQHPLHRGVHDHAARNRGAEGSTTCPAWPPARCAARSRCPSPDCGSDVAAIQSKAVRDGDDYVLNGQKMWLTNGGSSTLVAVLVRTDEDDPRRQRLQEDDDVPDREARGLRRGASRV